MKNWLAIIISLIVLGIVLFLFGKFSPLKAVSWATAVIGLIIGALALIFADVNWGKYIDKTL